MSKTKLILIIIVAAIVMICLSIPIGIYTSNRLVIKEYTMTINKDGDEFTIAHISDLHYPYTKIELNEITDALSGINPDLIFLTGDIIDSSTSKDEVKGLNGFLNRLGQYPNVYAVLGNHERINDSLTYYKLLLNQNNITLLENLALQITCKSRQIIIAGISDKAEYSDKTVEGLTELSSAPVFLLAHRPERFSDYLESTTDKKPSAIFSGHNHGGQAQIFGIGVISPATGLFPKYYDGLYKEGSSCMLVSRGLGDSVVPVRFFNSYHLPVLKIKL